VSSNKVARGYMENGGGESKLGIHQRIDSIIISKVRYTLEILYEIQEILLKKTSGISNRVDASQIGLTIA